MKRDPLQYILRIIVAVAIPYLLFSAFCWDWNPGEWNWFLRVVAVLWVALITYKAVTID